jgi:uncharacterized OB-fold protein
VTDPATPYGDALTRPFWAAATERRLVMQCCTACGRFQFYPRPVCLGCRSDRLEWREVSGRGTVYSATTVHLRYDPAFEPPYTVAMVELDEGPRLLTQIVDGEAPIGSRVMLVWHDRAGLPPMPFFRPLAEGQP